MDASIETATRVELRINRVAAGRAEGHESVVRALVGQLEDVVVDAGFSMRSAQLFPVLDEEDHLWLVLHVSGFERREDRLDLSDVLTDIVHSSEDPWISRRISVDIRSIDR